MALTTGLLILVVSVTGSIIVYEEPLDRLIAAGFYERQSTGPAPYPGTDIALSRIIQAAKGHRPAASIIFLDFRPLPDGPVIAVMDPPSSSAVEVSIDPVSGAIIGDRSVYHVLNVIRALHINLLAGNLGYTIIGLSGIVLLGIMGTGLYLWWPQGGKWKQALTFKKGASPHRRNVDLHRLFGIYTLVPLLVAVVTGIILVFPGYTIDPVLGPTRAERPTIRAADQKQSLPPDQVIPRARQAIDHGELALIHFPYSTGEPFYQLSFRSFEKGHPRGRSYVHVYSDNGEIRWAKATRDANFAYKLRWEWLVPTHSGDVAGHWGKIPILLSGLAPLGLMVTGLLMWLRRERSRRRSLKARSHGARSDWR